MRAFIYTNLALVLHFDISYAKSYSLVTIDAFILRGAMIII